MTSNGKRILLALLFNIVMVLISSILIIIEKNASPYFMIFVLGYLATQMILFFSYLAIFSKLKKTNITLILSPLLYYLVIIFSAYYYLWASYILFSVAFIFIQYYLLLKEKSIIYEEEEIKDKQKLLISSLFLWNIIIFTYIIALAFCFSENILYFASCFFVILLIIYLNELIIKNNTKHFKIKISFFQKLLLYSNLPLSLILFCFTSYFNHNIIYSSEYFVLKNLFVESFFCIITIFPYLYLNRYFFNKLGQDVEIAHKNKIYTEREKKFKVILKIDLCVSIVFFFSIIMSIFFYYELYFKIYVSIAALISVALLIYRNVEYNKLNDKKINIKWLIFDIICILYSAYYLFFFDNYEILAQLGSFKITFELITCIISVIIFLPSATISKRIDSFIKYELRTGKNAEEDITNN